MQKWTYLTLTAAYSGVDNLGVVKMYGNKELDNWKQRNWGIDAALEYLGDQGWELVTVLWRKTTEMGYADPVYYFKRPKE